jgi:hypothetical protein
LVPKKQSRKLDSDGEIVRRQTFTNEKWKTFYVTMRSYSAKKALEPTQAELEAAMKEVKRLCKEFGFTAGMLKDSLAEGWRR